MEKTKIVFLNRDKQYGEWNKDDIGYIDGYVTSDNIPYMVIINLLTKKPVLVPFGNSVEVVEWRVRK